VWSPDCVAFKLGCRAVILTRMSSEHLLGAAVPALSRLPRWDQICRATPPTVASRSDHRIAAEVG
jgi:hypothetical protein